MGRRNVVAQSGIALATILFAKLTRVLPLRVSRGLLCFLGRVALRLVPRVRKVGLSNLDLAYGEGLSKAEKARILAGAVENVALVAAEFSRLPIFAAEKFAGLVRVEGLEHLDVSRGCLCISGHIGNWEYMAPVLAAHGYKVAEVVRPLDAPALDRYVEGTREAGGIRTVPKDRAGAELLRLMEEGWIAGILMDQSPRENGVPGTFFGRACWSTVGPAMMAARSRVPVYFVTMLREGDGGYVLRVHPALALEYTESLRADLVSNTQKIQDAFEAIVRAHPDQWLWLHRRWKARPRLEREWAERVGKDRPGQNAPQGHEGAQC